MEKASSVNLERIKDRENEYIVKDTNGITAGRVFILELSEENRYCMIRAKFYRKNEYEIIKDTLRLLLRVIFNKKNIVKVNIIVDELVSTRPFTDLGLSLQGILEDNTFSSGEYRSELIFGITSFEFDKLHITNNLVLKVGEIELRILTPENCEDLLNYNVRNKEHLKNYEPLRDDSYFTLEAQRRILIEEYNQYLNGTGISFGIFKENKLIGKVKLSNIVYGVFKNCFLGYSIDVEEQGKGFMSKAVRAIIKYAFNDLELHRIEASTLIDNTRSQSVLKKCGFSELGLNKNYLYINGGWRDHLLFYIVKE